MGCSGFSEITEWEASLTLWNQCDLWASTLQILSISTRQAYKLPLTKLALSKLTPLFTADPIHQLLVARMALSDKASSFSPH